MDEYGERSANHVFAVGLIVLGLVYLTYVFLWFDFSGFMAMSQSERMTMTAFYIIASSALLILGYLLYSWDELLISFLLVGVGLLELANGIGGWFGYDRWEGAFLVLAIIIIIMAVMVLVQSGYILGMGMLAAAVAYILDALMSLQAGELMGTVMGAIYLLATIMFVYLGVAIVVNDEMDMDVLPIV
ncbi:MAG: hypothetical protein WCY65_01955 [Candidatus Methanomethylophilaceae archaeon]